MIKYMNIKSETMTFGQRLKLLRVGKNISQDALGEIVGVSGRVIGYYESDDRFPKDEEVLVKIADYFNISLDYLLGRVKGKYDINKPIQLAASMKDNLDLSEMSEKDKKVIFELYKTLNKLNGKE